MSLESEFGRIATALERIATILEQDARGHVRGAVPLASTEDPTLKNAEKFGKQPTTGEPPLAGAPVTSSVSSAAPSAASPSVEAEAVATTSDQVLDLAQKVAAQLGEKVPAFTEWVRKTLAEKYNIASQKIKHLSAEQIPNFARDVMAYASKAGVKV